MKARILSPVVGQRSKFAAVATLLLGCSSAVGQTPGIYEDPQTGIAYRQVVRTVERPVEETRMTTREETRYRPQTVTETRNLTRTYYTPVTQYAWEPRVHGRWNPFRAPTLAYHHVGRTHWEPRSEVVPRTTTRTEWVAERQTVEVPQRIVRMERQQQVDFEPIGDVAPKQAAPPSPNQALASRLRPLSADKRVVASGQSRLAASTFSAPRIAASSVGRLTSDPPQRNFNQGGMRSTNLVPTQSNVHGQPLPPASSGIATMPLRMFR